MTDSREPAAARPLSKRSLRRSRRREFVSEAAEDLRASLRRLFCVLTPPFGHEGVYVECVRGLLYETTCVGCGHTVTGFAKWGTGGYDNG